MDTVITVLVGPDFLRRIWLIKVTEDSSMSHHDHTGAGDFVVSMIEAFMSIGYYMPVNPQLKKARAEPEKLKGRG